jgi:RNA polymerase sigma factor (sigma-70 family)
MTLKTSESQGPGAASDKDDLDRLLLLLDPDRDRAGAMYVDLRRRLLYYFTFRGCLTGEELVDETITRVIRKLASGEEVINVGGYMFGVARFVLMEYRGGLGKEIAEIGDLAPSQQPYIDPLALEREREADGLTQRKHECMRRCLESLPLDERQLITDYCVKTDREQIASRLGASLKTLRVKVHRIRAKLKECLRAFLQGPKASEI